MRGQSDFAKVFDSVPYARLLLKARYYGIRGKPNEWLRDFLSDRLQCIVVNGSCSDWSNVSLGVLQGIVSDVSIADDNICIVKSFSSVSNVSVVCNSKKKCQHN